MMERYEIEKRIVQMAEEIKRFYDENVPNGGSLHISFLYGNSDADILIYNCANADRNYSGYVDVFSKGEEVYSLGKDGECGDFLRDKEGRWTK